MVVGVMACGGGSATSKKESGSAAAPAAELTYAALEVGADYKSFTKVNKEPFLSGDHGGRFVDVWVNEIGLEAYKNEEVQPPVGTLLVKTSWEAVDGKPSAVAGPIFVMEKRAQGFNEEHSDWWYAMHWENVSDKWQKRLGGKQVYWRSPSKKVNYCDGCHENYENEIGRGIEPGNLIY